MTTPSTPAEPKSDEELKRMELMLAVKKRELEVLELKLQLEQANRGKGNRLLPATSSEAETSVPVQGVPTPAQQVPGNQPNHQGNSQAQSGPKAASQLSPSRLPPSQLQPSQMPPRKRQASAQATVPATQPVASERPNRPTNSDDVASARAASSGAALAATASRVPEGKDRGGAGQQPRPQLEEAEGQERTQARRWASPPAWLISSLLHGIVVVLLALLTLPAPPVVEELLSLQANTEKLEPPQEVTVDVADLEVEEVEVELPQMAVVSEPDPGAAINPQAVAAVSEFEAQVGDLAEINVDISSLFGQDGQALAETGSGDGGAEFFGVKSGGDRFVFLLDSSLSMRGGKFEAATDELVYTVKNFTPRQTFYVIFFDHDTYRMFDQENPEPAAIAATSKNKQRLAKWVKTVDLELRTIPLGAVQFALKLHPDAIYILTDGVFTDRGRTARYLRENNKEDPILGTPPIPVHTIGFWDDKGRKPLEAISKASGGRYQFVPRPKMRRPKK